MAKPRVFISSTHYDLKNIRSDIERFISDQGYESVLSEKGQIPYSTEENLEEYCYREIEKCDIVLSVIGGRFGSESKGTNDDYSISNKELDTAFKLNKQVYIFIEKSVLSEFKTYKANSNNETIKYVSVDDIRIFKFIDQVGSRSKNNQIAPFETTFDITDYLKEQWAGLFQTFLKSSARQSEIIFVENLKKTSDTLNQLVNYLKKDKDDGDSAIKDILISNHPVFGELERILGLQYRIIFHDESEVADLLIAHKFTKIDQSHRGYKKEYHSWQDPLNASRFLRIERNIFDPSNGDLKPTTHSNRNDEFAIIDEIPSQRIPSFDDFDDDIPF